MARLQALVAGVLILLAAPAWAQTNAPPPTGTVTARAYAPLAAGAAIAVIPADDTDQSQRLKTAIEGSLRARGYVISDSARLQLVFYSTEVTGTRSSGNVNGARALESAVPNSEQAQSMGMLAPLNENLFGNDTSTANAPTGGSIGRQVHLSMMLSDQPAAKRIWQGNASGLMLRPDSFAATQSLVPFLVDKIGQSVTDARFDMP